MEGFIFFLAIHKNMLYLGKYIEGQKSIYEETKC